MSETGDIMEGRYIADQVQNGLKASRAMRALAVGFRACDAQRVAFALDLLDAVKERDELRAKLSAAFPCGFDEPRVVRQPVGATVEFGEFTLQPDEAMGIGARLIERAEEAREIAMHDETQGDGP